MALIKAELTHPDFGFTFTDETGNHMKIDVPVDQGGNGNGMRPMQTLLAALVGCSGVDVISILKKQRQEFNSLFVFIEGHREANKEPSLWQTIHLRFEFTGNLLLAKASRAVELSINKYCSVAETLKLAGAVITWTVAVNGEESKNI
jgi:putative redox protein